MATCVRARRASRAEVPSIRSAEITTIVIIAASRPAMAAGFAGSEQLSLTRSDQAQTPRIISYNDAMHGIDCQGLIFANILRSN